MKTAHTIIAIFACLVSASSLATPNQSAHTISIMSEENITSTLTIPSSAIVEATARETAKENGFTKFKGDVRLMVTLPTGEKIIVNAEKIKISDTPNPE